MKHYLIFTLLLLSGSAFAADSVTTQRTFRVTGLFSPERIDDLRLRVVILGLVPWSNGRPAPRWKASLSTLRPARW